MNATLIKGDHDQAVPALKAERSGKLIVSGCGELAHDPTRQGFVDEFWFWVHPHPWAGPRIFRRRRPGAAGAGGVDTIPLRRPLVALPAGDRLTQREPLEPETAFGHNALRLSGSSTGSPGAELRGERSCRD